MPKEEFPHTLMLVKIFSFVFLLVRGRGCGRRHCRQRKEWKWRTRKGKIFIILNWRSLWRTEGLCHSLLFSLSLFQRFLSLYFLQFTHEFHRCFFPGHYWAAAIIARTILDQLHRPCKLKSRDNDKRGSIIIAALSLGGLLLLPQITVWRISSDQITGYYLSLSRIRVDFRTS